ncbi:MAG: carbon-nitrogen hydrolase family protein [Liquorilactobacillus mali]|uniref:carbon-nitrogen hydrolase family protein n=1 Tax=Liquorilactobacillus mali TaxID=1618 RepID=UPI0039ED1D26
MKDLEKNCRIAVVQAAPIMFDKGETLKKVKKLVNETKKQKPELIVFPELFIPGYPLGMSFGFTLGKRDDKGRNDWKLYYDNSIIVPGEECRELGTIAKESHAYLSIGVSERDAVTSTLYNSNLIFSPEGELVSVHRKLKPTGTERVVWGDANKDFFPIVDTPWGPAGSLICWESYMPLARVALYQKGISIYIAPNTNDNEEWQSTIKHIAIEGHCYFINADMFFRKSDYPVDKLAFPAEIDKLPDIVCRGGSSVVDPYGHLVTTPLWDKEGIIYADLDMAKVPMSHMEFDGVGHYSRPDVLNLSVHDI